MNGKCDFNVYLVTHIFFRHNWGSFHLLTKALYHALISNHGLLSKLNTEAIIFLQHGVEVISLRSRQLPTHYAGDEYTQHEKQSSRECCTVHAFYYAFKAINVLSIVWQISYYLSTYIGKITKSFLQQIVRNRMSKQIFCWDSINTFYSYQIRSTLNKCIKILYHVEHIHYVNLKDATNLLLQIFCHVFKIRFR